MDSSIIILTLTAFVAIIAAGIIVKMWDWYKKLYRE